MNLMQAFKMAFKSIASKKMRSFLTMLGIIIGVASVVIMVSVVGAPVGSSAMMMGGWVAMARAMATRCCCPPDISVGLCLARSNRSTRSKACSTKSRRLEPRTP